MYTVLHDHLDQTLRVLHPCSSPKAAYTHARWLDLVAAVEQRKQKIMLCMVYSARGRRSGRMMTVCTVLTAVEMFQMALN